MLLDALAAGILGVGLVFGAWFRRPVVGVLAGFCFAEVLAPFLDASVFGLMRIAAWALFVALPAALVVRGWFGPRWWGLLALPICAVGVDAFFIEPTALEVSHVTLHSEKISTPRRIALVADIQTDRVGDYERRVFDAVVAEDPDLVLYAGDYIQAEHEATAGEVVRLNAELKLSGLGDIPGVAIEGDVDRSGWADVFSGTQVATKLGEHGFGEVFVTAWSPEESRSNALRIPPSSRFHIALGHSPDFVRSSALNADLVLAGHVHGGQVQIPFYGPLMTLSALPREQTHGHTSRGDVDLVVSRGIGLERRDAPRLRFLCRPEVVILHLLPELSPG